MDQRTVEVIRKKLDYGLRNRIVHDYETLDDRILFDSAKRLLKDAQAFLKAVNRYLIAASSRK